MKDLLDSFRGFDKLSVFFKYLNIYSADILISMTVRVSLEFLTGDTQKAKAGLFVGNLLSSCWDTLSVLLVLTSDQIPESEG